MAGINLDSGVVNSSPLGWLAFQQVGEFAQIPEPAIRCLVNALRGVALAGQGEVMRARQVLSRIKDDWWRYEPEILAVLNPRIIQLLSDLMTPADACSDHQVSRPVVILSLGRFEVRLHGSPLSFARKSPRVPLSLLKIIVAHGGQPVPLGQVIDFLWPNLDGDAAHRALTTALYRLRALIGREAVLQQDGCLSLNPRLCWVDLWEFNRQAEGVGMDKLLGLYRGEFLPGSMEPWSLGVAVACQQRFIRICAHHLSDMASSIDHIRIESLIEEIAAIDQRLVILLRQRLMDMGRWELILRLDQVVFEGGSAACRKQ